MIEVVRRAIGTPFHHQGRRVGIGLDCSGLAVFLADVLEIDVPSRDLTYAKRPFGSALFDHVKSICLPHPDPTKPFEAGELHLFWIGTSQFPSHLGFCTPENLIHADHRYGVVEHVYPASLKKRLMYRFLVPGIKYSCLQSS